MVETDTLIAGIVIVAGTGFLCINSHLLFNVIKDIKNNRGRENKFFMLGILIGGVWGSVFQPSVKLSLVYLSINWAIISGAEYYFR